MDGNEGRKVKLGRKEEKKKRRVAGEVDKGLSGEVEWMSLKMLR